MRLQDTVFLIWYCQFRYGGLIFCLKSVVFSMPFRSLRLTVVPEKQCRNQRRAILPRIFPALALSKPPKIISP